MQFTGVDTGELVFSTVFDSTLSGFNSLTVVDSQGVNNSLTVVGNVLRRWVNTNTPTGSNVFDTNHVEDNSGTGTEKTSGASTGFDSDGPTGHFALNASHVALGTATSASALAEVPTLDHYEATRGAPHDRGAVES
jgi:hypothetical protein